MIHLNVGIQKVGSYMVGPVVAPGRQQVADFDNFGAVGATDFDSFEAVGGTGFDSFGAVGGTVLDSFGSVGGTDLDRIGFVGGTGHSNLTHLRSSSVALRLSWVWRFF